MIRNYIRPLKRKHAVRRKHRAHRFGILVSEAVLEAQGCIMTNKYAEGYPGNRYYGGCEFVDMAENLAIERCKKLFGADHVNVQPHSGTQANMAVYFATVQPWVTQFWE